MDIPFHLNPALDISVSLNSAIRQISIIYLMEIYKITNINGETICRYLPVYNICFASFLDGSTQYLTFDWQISEN